MSDTTKPSRLGLRFGEVNSPEIPPEKTAKDKKANLNRAISAVKNAEEVGFSTDERKRGQTSYSSPVDISSMLKSMGANMFSSQSPEYIELQALILSQLERDNHIREFPDASGKRMARTRITSDCPAHITATINALMEHHQYVALWQVFQHLLEKSGYIRIV